jgi:hypothetical protein
LAGGHPPGGRGGPINPQQEQLLRAYVRDNADYYLGKWRQMDASGKRTSFNFAAFFLNALWLIYRKMWGLGLGILAGLLVLNVIMLAIAPALSSLVSLLSLGMAIYVGLMGNSMYRRRAEAEVMRAAATSPDPHGRMSVLARRGGTNIGAAIGIAIAVVVLNGIVMFTILGLSGALNSSTMERGAPLRDSNENASAMADMSAEPAPDPTRQQLIGRWGVSCGAGDVGLVFNDDGTMRLGDGGGRWEVEGRQININHDDGEAEVLTIRALTDKELRFTSNSDPQVDMLRRCS